MAPADGGPQGPPPAPDGLTSRFPRRMGLSRRLALLTAIMSVLLVLGATEVSLRLSERSRLEDYHNESAELAQSWATFLTTAAPTGDIAALRDAFQGWPTETITRLQAVVLLREGDALRPVALSAKADTVSAGLEDARALSDGRTSVWYTPGREAWQVATPLGGAHPYGVLRVRVSTHRLVEWAARERRRAYLLALLSALLVASGVGFLTNRWVARPLAHLGRTMAQAHGGVEGAPSAQETGAEEFRVLARRYNELRAALTARQRESDARAALLALEERARGFDRLALAEETASEFAHEIGTPLNTVRGHLQLLRDDLRQSSHSDDEAAQDRVRLVLGQVDRVSSIVRTQLSSRVWPTPAPHSTDLGAVARRVVQFLEPSFSRAGVRASVEAGDSLAWCDPALVEQILLNLLKNAVEALAPGGSVFITTGGGRQAWLEVADTGPGLAAEARQHLFEPFATTKDGAGTGLGLAVSRRLARASGGDLIHVPSERGATWRLTLPAEATHD